MRRLLNKMLHYAVPYAPALMFWKNEELKNLYGIWFCSCRKNPNILSL